MLHDYDRISEEDLYLQDTEAFLEEAGFSETPGPDTDCALFSVPMTPKQAKHMAAFHEKNPKASGVDVLNAFLSKEMDKLG